MENSDGQKTYMGWCGGTEGVRGLQTCCKVVEITPQLVGMIWQCDCGRWHNIRTLRYPRSVHIVEVLKSVGAL